MSTSHQAFDITATINGELKGLKVTPIETSDGVVYYSCCIENEELTQVRNEIYGKWEQLWGNLDQESVNNLGKQIEIATDPK